MNQFFMQSFRQITSARVARPLMSYWGTKSISVLVGLALIMALSGYTYGQADVSGFVLGDGNGLSNNMVDGGGVTIDVDPVAPGDQFVYVSLVSAGTVIATTQVQDGGFYSFTSVAPGSYSLVLTTNPAGSTTPSLPANYANTGEVIGEAGVAMGSDGTPNGILAVSIVGTTTVENANFGLSSKPYSSGRFTTLTLNNSTNTPQVNVPRNALTLVDTEGSISPDLTLSPATGGILYYNGTPITSTTIITGFNPDLVTLDPTATGATSASFTYTGSDEAGLVSNPVTVTLNFTVPPASQPSFNCGAGTAYLVVGRGELGNSSTTDTTFLFNVDLLTGTSTQLSGPLVPGPGYLNLNNLGFNPTDNYLWAYRRETGQVVRIGSDNSIQTFSIPGLRSRAYIAGDIDANGIMYLFQGNNSTNTIVRVDLNPASPTYLSRLSDIILTPASPDSRFIIDLSINPVDGNLYGVSGNNGNLFRINIATGAVTDLGNTGIVDFDNGFGTAYFDNTGNLYVSANQTGNLYRIPNVAGGNATATFLATSPVTSNQDGARCANAPIPTVSISGTVFNDANGLTDNTINGTPVSSLGGNTLYANLVGPNGDVLASTTLTSGTYSFTVSPNQSYTVVLSNTPGTVGSPPPSTTLTGGVVNTGENVGAGPGNDGTPNGVISVSVGTGNVTNVNFGVRQAPDLTPIITARQSTVYNTTPITVVVDVYELLNVPTSGLITLKVPKDPRFTLSFDPTATSVNGQAVQNSSWTYGGLSGGFYTFTTTNVIAGNIGTGMLSFGMTGTLTPGATQGTLTFSSIIVGGSGGEIRIDNNNDADKIDYFEN